VRPDGLDAAGHYSSARDVFRLARIVMHQPLVRRIVAMRTATIAGGRDLHTWNDLLGTYRGTYGIKTGHTDAAGWNEVAAVRRDGIPIWAVVLGSPTRSVRNDALVELLNWGFAQYGRLRLVSTGRVYASAGLLFAGGRVPLVAARTGWATVRLDSPLHEEVTAPAALEGPIAKGAKLGEVRVYSGDRLLLRVPLAASRDVAGVGFGSKLAWYAGRTAHEAGNLLESLVAAVLP
jgi:D-alanyl-D-alanine carboxypeptidase